LRPRTKSQTSFGRALQNLGWLLTGKGVGAVLSLIYLALATRSLGVEKFGQFSLILGIAQAAAALIGFETWQIMVRFGMTHLQKGRNDALARLTGFCITLDACAALVGCVISVVALSIMHWQFGWSTTQTQLATMFCIVMLLAARSTAIGILRLHDRFATSALAESVTPIARFVGAVFVTWQRPTVSGFLIAWAVAEVLTAAACWISAMRVHPHVAFFKNGVARLGDENPGLWRFAWQTNFTSAINASSRQFVLVLVGFVAGPAAAGGYRLAYQLSQALVVVSDLFSRALFPEVTRVHAGDRAEDLARLSRQSARLALWAGLITCVAVPALGRIALQLVAGKSYLGTYPLLVVLGLAAGLNIMAVGFEPVLLGTGRAGQVLTIRVASAVVMFGSMVPLMSMLGVIGAGFATLAGSLLALILLIVGSRQVLTHARTG
jgi:O-antigen/teichoic acid export membrane protein